MGTRFLRRLIAAGAALAAGGLLAGAAFASTPLNAQLTGPSRADAGQAVRLDASLSTGDGLRYDWNFGDGTYDLGAAVMTHTYDSPGDYTVTVDIVDASGQDSVASLTLTILEPSDFPNAAPAESGDRVPPAPEINPEEGLPPVTPPMTEVPGMPAASLTSALPTTMGMTTIAQPAG